MPFSEWPPHYKIAAVVLLVAAVVGVNAAAAMTLGWLTAYPPLLYLAVGMILAGGVCLLIYGETTARRQRRESRKSDRLE